MQIIAFFLLFFSTISYQCLAQVVSQNKSDELIDPVFIPCWALHPDSSIRPLKLNSRYVGRVVVKAQGDTVSFKLINFEFLFAKLKSKANNNDSIELRLDYKIGNAKAFDSLKQKIIDHLSYLKIKRTNIKNCNKQSITFNIPIRIQ